MMHDYHTMSDLRRFLCQKLFMANLLSSTDKTSQTGCAPRSTSNIVDKTTNAPGINGTGSNEFRLRLCHVVQWPSYDGYGFMVHTLKDLPGQYVGQIEKNSPAQQAGT